MGRITSGVGLVSGINSRDIIDQLMALEAKPKDLLNSRIETANQQKLAYTDLTTRLTSLRLSATTLKKPSSFQSAKTATSDENVLTATASNGAAIGSFQFQVARLVTSQQTVSKGFASFDSSPVGAGTLTIEQGGGELARQTMLGELNGGAGVRRGSFRITDRSGASATIDVTAAVSLDDVVKKINTSLGIQVKASIDGDKLVLNDLTGKTTNNLIVQDLGDAHAAEDLGLIANVAANLIEGTDINFLSVKSNLAQINDGRGIGTASTGADFTVTVGDGSSFQVTLAGKKSLGDVIDAINTAGGAKIKASVAPGTNGLTIQDTSGGGGAFTIAAVGDSTAAADLGILKTGAAGTITGSQILSGLNTVLVSSLNGGSGLALGSISVQSRAASGGTTIDLSGAISVADVIDTINAAGAGVKASLNASGNGLQIVDTSGGAGSLIIAESGGTTATDLGLAGTFDLNTPSANGKNLQRAWVGKSTLLADYNGGKGVAQGKFKITTASGATTTVDISQGNEVRIGDVIKEINAKNIGVTASINVHGDGLLLTDTTTGSGKLTVADDGGTTATDLNIKGTATTTTIDGSYEKTIAVTASDTLATLQTKINDLGFSVTASIINDGSGGAPYRLSINALNSGRAGRVVFDAGATTLDTHNLVEAQDAAVFLGSAGSDQPLLITASKNQLSGVIKGVNIDLHATSDKPVTLGVTRSAENVSGEVQKFTDGFNELVDRIKELTKFDTETNERGLLLGDSTVQNVQTTIYAMINAVVVSGGKYRTLGDVGLTVGEGGKLAFDADKFNTAYGDNPQAVQNLFATVDTPIGSSTSLTRLNSGRGVRSNGGPEDLRFLLRDGTSFGVSLGSVNTIGEVVEAINTAGGVKIKASLGATGNLTLIDQTNGSKKFVASSSAGSLALSDLGLNVVADGKTLNGKTLSVSGASTTNAGVGLRIEGAISQLIDPVSGVITRESKTIESKTQQFQDRISSLDKLIEQKRTRLEKQFANMESVLAGLQSQQTALGQIKSIAA